MKRKRAPGGGGKPGASRPARPLTIRMDDKLREQLQTVADKRAERRHSWNISQEILLRLRASLDKDYNDRHNLALRALCYLISEMGRREFFTDAPDRQSWHRDPFTFRAFKLAVTRLLEGLEPPGEIRPAPEMRGRFQTPDELAAMAADHMLYTLFNTRPLTKDQKEFLIENMSLTSNFMQTVIEHLPEFEREFYAMASARRNLGLAEPKELKP
jgi:hypothetical protein